MLGVEPKSYVAIIESVTSPKLVSVFVKWEPTGNSELGFHYLFRLATTYRAYGFSLSSTA